MQVLCGAVLTVPHAHHTTHRREHAKPRTRGLGVFCTTTVCDGMYGIALSYIFLHKVKRAIVPPSVAPPAGGLQRDTTAGARAAEAIDISPLELLTENDFNYAQRVF